MRKNLYLKSVLAASASLFALASPAMAVQYNVPGGDLKAALDAYALQAGVQLIVADDTIRGAHTRGVSGDLSADAALSRILAGTGLVMHRHESGAIAVVRDAPDVSTARLVQATPVRMVADAAASASIESVVVTSSKIKGDIQTVPIAITALSQEQLTSRQIAGGPDLVKEVPNLTFSKTNFTGYNIQIRGIGTQAISVTTDPAVAVALNDIPFIRNHFFEQEFFDVNQVEVLRGPQGTLYGRNATAGVVNVISAKPTDQFEAAASADFGNYHNRRYEGMINIPIVDDRLDLRVAGEWTKRDGYTFNETTGQPIDGRDLWSTRVTLGMKPFENVQATLVWEHFGENDDRLRSAKQLCDYDPGPTQIGPFNQSFTFAPEFQSEGPPVQITAGEYVTTLDRSARGALSQGCIGGSLYSSVSDQTPNGAALPIVYAAWVGALSPLIKTIDPYASDTQPKSLRVIESELKPLYQAKNDTLEFNVDYALTPALTVTSQTGYNTDLLASIEDFNRFNSNPGIFFSSQTEQDPGCPGCTGDNGQTGALFSPGGVFCDPQLGCSTKFVGEDLSQEHSWQLSQEFRLASNFTGPLNFSVGGNYLHYETFEDYYVFLNLLTLVSRLSDKAANGFGPEPEVENGLCGGVPQPHTFPTKDSISPLAFNCPYTDGTPLTPGFNGEGHNYFRSENPYILNSYAGFGEAYYQVTPDLKLTGGLRWTSDQKHVIEIPSEVLIAGWGYPATGAVDQEWNEWTGRAVANWTPKLDFTDQTLVYGSFARGYKAGGANPPPPNFFASFAGGSVTHPLTFAPEFIDAYELGTKNTLADGALTFNGDVFYYDYKGYQISQIVDRTSVNLNFNATVKGAELESSWEPLPGLKFSFAGGYEDTRLANGSQAIDLMDRTAGHPGWSVVKPWIGAPSNCILPDYVLAELILGGEGATAVNGGSTNNSFFGGGRFITSLINGEACAIAYGLGEDPVIGTQELSTLDSSIPPSGFDPSTAPNHGEGFYKDISGNQLPNAPHFTTSLSADYTMPVSEDWAATLHSDFYWQSQSFARVFNDRPYDKLRGYSNVNLALILTSASGWQVMGYLKNVFNTTAITGAFLNSDDTALTTNVFVTDPRLFGVRVTKNW